MCTLKDAAHASAGPRSRLRQTGCGYGRVRAARAAASANLMRNMKECNAIE